MTEAVTRHDPHAFTRYIMGLLVGTASYTLCLTLFWSTEATLKKWLIAYAISAFHGLGITVGYHRLLSHRSFKCYLWVEYALALMGMCGGQHTPIMWVSRHRRHHRHADTEDDSHSPANGILWSHMGVWMIWNEEAFTSDYAIVPELVKHRFYRAMDLLQMDCVIMVARSLVCYKLGGIDTLVWWALVPYVMTHQLTFCINSMAHSKAWMSYRTYKNSDNAHNTWYLGYFVVGEGWHNNHHTFPYAASFGMEWWEWDLGTALIYLLRALGLAWDLRSVPEATRAKRKAAAVIDTHAADLLEIKD